MAGAGTITLLSEKLNHGVFVSVQTRQGTWIVSYPLARASAVSYELFDAMGKVVFAKPTFIRTVGAQVFSIRYSDFTAGSYVLRLKAGGVPSCWQVEAIR